MVLPVPVLSLALFVYTLQPHYKVPHYNAVFNITRPYVMAPKLVILLYVYSK